MPDDVLQLQLEPIDTSVVLSAVSDPGAGGIALFVGTTRSEQNAAGKELAALHYEAYDEMALSQLRDLSRRVREKWPVLRVGMIHRLGRVPLGHSSVAIAVSSPHRAEAFEACRWLIDTLKSEVAIWKREIWEDGSGTWAQPGERTDAGTGR